MNEPRISSLEKDVEILKVTINPLLEKMDKNTEATINLTSKVGFMLEKFDKVEENQKDQEDRLIDLEKKDYAAQSGRDLIRHFKFALHFTSYSFAWCIRYKSWRSTRWGHWPIINRTYLAHQSHFYLSLVNYF